MEDQSSVEIYDGDLLLFQHRKHIVSWDHDDHFWIWTDITNQAVNKFTLIEAEQSLRLCHSFESDDFSEND